MADRNPMMPRWLQALVAFACVVVLGLGLQALADEKKDETQINRNTQALKASCVAQAASYAGIITNLAFLLETSVQLSKVDALPPAAREVWANNAKALTPTLDEQFKKVPRCGEKLEFTIEITDQPKREVSVTPTPTPSD